MKTKIQFKLSEQPDNKTIKKLYKVGIMLDDLNQLLKKSKSIKAKKIIQKRIEKIMKDNNIVEAAKFISDD